MVVTQLERSPTTFEQPEGENIALADLKLALATFQKLKLTYGPLKPTQPFSPLNVFGDIQRFATRGYFESVIDANEHSALIRLAAEVQMILITI